VNAEPVAAAAPDGEGAPGEPAVDPLDAFEEAYPEDMVEAAIEEPVAVEITSPEAVRAIDPEFVPDTSYTRAEKRIWSLLNAVAVHATRDKTVLKPGDTFEIPEEVSGQPTSYVFFARFSSRVKPFFKDKRMSGHLLLVVEITAEEFEKAKKVGGVNFTNYLKVNNRWPYCL
ncbi:MAG: hypothetical protein LIP77_02710, partial [Planctomycetes bacterium]|nr:hypothetical protein [Planctomycetota bacterium]